MRTIKIVGTGTLRVHPDTTVITMELTGISPMYSEAVEMSAQRTDMLKAALSPLGFDRTDIKTLSFDIEANYESYEENGAYRRRLTGYSFTHRAKLSFASDNLRLGNILAALADCEAKPLIEISYTVRDSEAAKNTLLANAVSDARKKAETLTAAAGVKLCDIQSIEYSRTETDMSIRPMMKCLDSRESSCLPDIDPDDINLSGTVTVTWQIE